MSYEEIRLILLIRIKNESIIPEFHFYDCQTKVVTITTNDRSQLYKSHFHTYHVY